MTSDGQYFKVVYIALMVLIGCLTSCITNKRDSVRAAKDFNDHSSLISKDITHFLIDEIDNHRFMQEAGLVAMEQGGSQSVRNYAEVMVRDQSLMIKEIGVIASCRKIALPETMSNSKVRTLQSLKSKQAKDFDKKFIKLFVSNHRNDIKEFEKATVFKDRYVRIFARRYLPMLQTHLVEIEKIRDGEVPQETTDIITVVSN